MPANPFSTAVTLDELWKNILQDMGQAPQTVTPGPIEMKTILRLLDLGLFGKNLGVYGDGSDGVLNFVSTGSTTLAGATLSGGTYTMTRDIYAASGTVIPSATTIVTAGFRFFCQGLLTLNGTIQWNGNAGSNGTSSAGGAAGAALSAAYLGGSTAGGAGSTTNGANAAAGPSASMGSAGGAGGAGNSGTAGAAPTVTAPTAASGGIKNLPTALNGWLNVAGTNTKITGGAGGGGGGGDGTAGGGGGGGGGGVVIVAAQQLAGSGLISASGGVGGNGYASSVNGCGGGGGGGGGWVVLITANLLTASAGSSSAGSGTGVPSAGGISPGNLTGWTGSAVAFGQSGGTAAGTNGVAGVAGASGNVTYLSA